MSLLGDKPAILRLGGIPREDIRKLVGDLAPAPVDGPALAPGMKHRHYAPEAKVRLVPAHLMMQEWRKHGGDPTKAFIVSAETAAAGMAGRNVAVPGPKDDAEAWAHDLFAMLRKWDRKQEILVEPIPEKGLGAAVMERLRKAAEGGPKPTTAPSAPTKQQ